VAAIALADAGGIAAVSMRAVATALNTSPGSLYRYVTSRDDILDLMTDRVLGELRPFPDVDGDWLNEMLLLGCRQLDLFRRHPWLLDVTPRSSSVGPNSLAWFDNCLHVLQPVPCSVAAKFETIAMMTGVTTLFARSEASPPSFTVAGIDLTAYPHLAAAFTPPTTPSPPRDLFERTLRSLLVGLLTAELPDRP
jgi:AcrR family transcriptional regulator